MDVSEHLKSGSISWKFLDEDLKDWDFGGESRNGRLVPWLL